MEKWDPRGPLARATCNKVIHGALAKIKHPCFKMAAVLAVVRAPYPRFDPINMNPQFPLEAMLIVFRTQNPYFDPINYDAKVIINILLNFPTQNQT